MSEEAAFLMALKANPADDTARLVYADWLDEHDQPHKAEYLRLVAELVRTFEEPRSELTDRILNVSSSLAAEWRVTTAARFALRLTSDPPHKIEAIKLVREITGMGLGRAKAFVESAPNPLPMRTTAESALGMLRYYGYFALTLVRPELLGGIKPTFAQFPARLRVLPINYYFSGDLSELTSTAHTAVIDFLCVALSLDPKSAAQRMTDSVGSIELVRDVEYTELQNRVAHWENLLPESPDDADWLLTIERSCSLNPFADLV